MTTVRTSPSKGPDSPEIVGFHEPCTGSIQYVVVDPTTTEAAIIDPVWDFNPPHARTDTSSADEILRFVAANGLKVVWVLDTHPHADHFTAAPPI
jgi:glyoxylase-like metal-dependent hydrolase (beta-lactamase superfamily II)